MKGITVAIVAAGIAGAQAEGWGQWSSTTEVEPTPITTTTTEAPTTTTTTTVEPTPTTTATTTEEPTTTIPIISDPPSPSPDVPTTTSVSTTEDPSTTGGWGQWSSTTEKEHEPTTTTTEKEHESTTSTTEKVPETTTTSTTEGWNGWSSTTDKHEITTTKVPEHPETTSSKGPEKPGSSTWNEWEESTSTTTITSTITETKTVWPVKSSSTSWAEWASSSAPVWPQPSAPGDQCIIKTYTTYGEPTWAPNPGPTPSTTKVEVIPTAVPVPSSSSEWNQWASAPSSSPSSKPTPKTGGSGIGGGGQNWGMTYSPYTASSGCKDKDVIAKDIAAMAAKGFTSVRVYSTDCYTLEYVGDACRASGLKMILGVFISKTGVDGAAKQVTDIVGWAQWDIVELIVVGNEAVFNKFATPEQLAGLIGTAKTAFQAAGYNGAVTTTEDLATWTSYGAQWCGVVDVVAANLYAFFNPNTTPDQAGDLINAQIAELGSVCGDKATYVMESGWPSAGECNGVACPGEEEQATAIRSIQQANGAKVIFFSFEDELWKDPGVHGVEQHWGCSKVFPDM